jgi:hypothetical protein
MTDGPFAVTGEHAHAVARAESEGDALGLCRLAGISFARQHPQLIRKAREECVRLDEMGAAFGDGLAARLPDEVEFDLYWESLQRSGQLAPLEGTAAGEHARGIAERAWMTSRKAVS